MLLAKILISILSGDCEHIRVDQRGAHHLAVCAVSSISFYLLYVAKYLTKIAGARLFSVRMKEIHCRYEKGFRERFKMPNPL